MKWCHGETLIRIKARQHLECADLGRHSRLLYAARRLTHVFVVLFFIFGFDHCSRRLRRLNLYGKIPTFPPSTFPSNPLPFECPVLKSTWNRELVDEKK